MSGRFVAALALLIGLAAVPAEALAGPHVQVGIALPPVRVALPHVSVEVVGPVVHRAPEYVWVEGYYTHDRWGHAVWVPGRWELVAPPPPPRVVTVHGHGHGHGHGNGHGPPARVVHVRR